MFSHLFIRFQTLATLIMGLTYGLPAIGAVPSQYYKKPNDWFRSTDGLTIADNVLSWQSDNGSWPKNQDTASQPNTTDTSKLKGTFDNGATTSELRFLARAALNTKEFRFRDAFIKGLDLILQAQYPTGGWPQRIPLGRDYGRHITFNDGTMVRILELLRDTANTSEFQFVDEQRRAKAELAFERGIECILKCQIMVDGMRTVWCAQHDESDYQPRPARAYELVSLSGAESAGVLKLLMSLDKPSSEVRQAIHAGAAWFESAKISGLRVDKIGGDTVVVKEPKSRPMWARFYEIETNRPFFCGRDGLRKYQLSEIESERRNGYSWYGGWGNEVAEHYGHWKQKWGSADAGG